MDKKKTKVIILSRTQQNSLVNNMDTKEGKIAADTQKKGNKNSAFDLRVPCTATVKVLLVCRLLTRTIIPSCFLYLRY